MPITLSFVTSNNVVESHSWDYRVRVPVTPPIVLQSLHGRKVALWFGKAPSLRYLTSLLALRFLLVGKFNPFRCPLGVPLKGVVSTVDIVAN